MSVLWQRVGRLAVIAAAAVLCLGRTLPVHGQATSRQRADRVLERMQKLAEKIPIPMPGFPAVLSSQEEDEAQKLISRPPNFATGNPTQFLPLTPGGFRWKFGREPDLPIFLVESDFDKLGDPSFLNAVTFLRAMQGLAAKNGAVPGRIHRGMAGMCYAGFLYRTNRAWSHSAKEEIAAYYVLKAANNGNSIGLSLGKNEVQHLLQQLYAGGQSGSQAVEAIASILLDPPPEVQPDERPREAIRDRPQFDAFSVANILAPGTEVPLHSDTTLPDDIRQAAMRIIATIEQNPLAFAHLPGRFRLLRRARVVAAGQEPTWVARKELGLEVAGGNGKAPAQVRSELEQQCKAWREQFDREVRLRGDGPVAMSSADEVNWDPHALAELAALMIDHSVQYAKRVRVPVAEGELQSDGEKARRVKDALQADPVLKSLLDRYGWPDAGVLDEPSAPCGKALVLHWRLGPKGQPEIDHVWLVVVDGFSRGGAGLPLEPGLAADQQAKVRRPSIATPPTNVTLADLQVGNFLESVTELKPGLKTPSAATRWHQLGDTKTFGRTQSVRLDTESYGSLVGTPSQEVWAEHTRSGRTKWDWVPMGDLRAGDRLWQAEAGAVRIQRSGRGKAAPSYVQLTLAGSEHTFCNRFLVHCQSRVIPAESRHGLLASTPVLLSAGKEGPQFRVLAEIDADFTARRFVPCIGFSDRTALVRRQKDLLIGVPRDETPVLIWIGFEIERKEHWVGVAYSHGLLVVRDGKRSVCPAHNIRQGDALVRDEKDCPPAKVIDVGIEEAPHGGKWPLCHPRLLRGEWVQAGGVLAHTAQRPRDVSGLHPATRIALGRIGSDGGNRSSQGGILVRPESPQIVKLATYQPGADGAPAFPFHALLACWPGGPTEKSESSEFSVRVVDRLYEGVTGDVIRVVTDDSQVLTCGPATRLWKYVNKLDGDRVQIKTVRADHLVRGDRVFALAAPSGPARTRFVTVITVDWIDAFETVPEFGYYDLYDLDLKKSLVGPIAQFEERYDNIFANSLLVCLAEPDHELDLWKAFKGRGDGAGVESGVRPAWVPGPLHEAGAVADSPIKAPALSGNLADPQAASLSRFDQAELKLLALSLDETSKEVRASLAKETPIPSDPARAERWDRFAKAMLPRHAQRMEKALNPKALQRCFNLYCENRSLLLRSGHPQALEAMARIGVPLAYMFAESGRPEAGHAILRDLLLVQMRLALRRETGPSVWKRPDLLVRDSVRFALEFSDLVVAPDDPNRRLPAAGKSAVQRFWDVTWEARSWSDMLHQRTDENALNNDIVAKKHPGDEPIFLYNLLIQMDRWAGISGQDRPLAGFVQKDFQPGTEFLGEIQSAFANR